MRFSIIIPIYNVERFLRDCLESVKGQTYADFEVLMVDDGSKDGSGKICDEYAAQDARFRVYHKKNGGLSDARNVGMEHAQGDFLVFLDADDFMTAEALAVSDAAIRKDDLQLVQYAYVRVDEEGRETGEKIDNMETEVMMGEEYVASNAYRIAVWGGQLMSGR